MFTYVYITGCAILAVAWLFIFLLRKDLRREMVWASLVGMPFGLIDYFLIPHYWSPKSLFGLIEKYGVGIESFLFIFLMAGIASVLYEFLEHKKIKKISRDRKIHIVPLVGSLLALFFLMLFAPSQGIYNFILAAVVGAGSTMLLRKDLRRQIITTGFIFSVFYYLVFVVTNLLFKNWVTAFYNLPNTWGIMITGIPLEEIVTVFFAGAFWSAFYEYARGYRERD